MTDNIANELEYLCLAAEKAYQIDHLRALPAELLCGVYSFCQPLDLLSIRLCSKFHSEISRTPAIWRVRLQILCWQMRLSVCGLAPTTSDYAQSEHLVLAHLRFISMLKNHNASADPLTPQLTRCINTDQDGMGPSLSCVRQIFGGRYLLTLSEQILQLFDLGEMNIGSRPPLASCIVPVDPAASKKADKFIHCVRFDGSDSKARFSVIYEDFVDEVYSCWVYDVTPTHSQPAFVLVGSHLSNESVTFSTCRGDVLGLLFPDDTCDIGIYDLKTGMTVKWWTPNGNISDVDILDDGTVVALSLHDRESHLYAIPKVDDPSSPSIVIKDNPPIASASFLECRAENTTTQMFMYDASSWLLSYDPLHSEFCTDIIGRDVSDGSPVAAARHVLTRRRWTKEDGVWKFALAHSSTYDGMPLSYGDAPYSLTFPTGHRLLWWEDLDESRIFLHMSDLEGADNPVTTVLYSAEADDRILGEQPLRWPKYSFSPFLGRLCVVHGREVKVFDFVD